MNFISYNEMSRVSVDTWHCTYLWNLRSIIF